MAETEEQREQRAVVAGEDELAAFLHDPSPRVIKAVLANRNTSEEDVLIVATRKNLPGDVLETIAKDKRWIENYPIRLALAKNPKTPLFSALSIVRFLRLFDQVELTRMVSLPLIFRQKVEAILVEKIPTLALGVKKTLAKIAAGNVLIKLIQDGYPEVVDLALSNPHLAEAHLYKVISREETRSGTIRQIAGHPNWSLRYPIRYALIRNSHTPLSRSALFLSGMKTGDLKELFRDPSLPAGVKPCIHRVLLERGEDMERMAQAPDEEEKVFEFGEDEAEDLNGEIQRYEEERREDEQAEG